MKRVSQERFRQFHEVALKRFNWDMILQDTGIAEITDKVSQYEIACPLHEDKRPSMRLNKETGSYHCFSCGASGSYVKFLWEVGGKAIPYPEFCDQVLKAHPEMQMELKFQSIFVTEKSLDPEFKGRRVYDPNKFVGGGIPISVLSREVRSLDDTWENLALSLTLLQQGIETDGVLTLVKRQNIQVNTSVEKTSLADLLSQSVI